LNAPAALPLGRNPVPTNWEAKLTPEPVWTVWRREKSVATTGHRTTISRFSRLYQVTVPTELTRLTNDDNNKSYRKSLTA
jgi:hypothetical protein